MERIEDYNTLEDFILNVPDPSMKDIIRWVKFKYPGGPTKVLAETVDTIIYGLKGGSLKVSGDLVTLREWDSN